MLYKPVSYTAHFQNFSYEKFENFHFFDRKCLKSKFGQHKIFTVQKLSINFEKIIFFFVKNGKPWNFAFSGVTFHSDKSQIFTTKF